MLIWRKNESRMIFNHTTGNQVDFGFILLCIISLNSCGASNETKNSTLNLIDGEQDQFNAPIINEPISTFPQLVQLKGLNDPTLALAYHQ